MPKRSEKVKKISADPLRIFQLKKLSLKIERCDDPTGNHRIHESVAGFRGFEINAISESNAHHEQFYRFVKGNSDEHEIFINPSRWDKCFVCARVFYRKRLRQTWKQCTKCDAFRCFRCLMKSCFCRESSIPVNDDSSREIKNIASNASNAFSEHLRVSRVCILEK